MLWAHNRAEPRSQAVLNKMAEPGAILHLPARRDKIIYPVTVAGSDSVGSLGEEARFFVLFKVVYTIR